LGKYGNASEPLFMAFSEWPHYLPNPSEVTAEERQVVEEWLRRRHGLPNDGMDVAVHIKKYFDRNKGANHK